MLLALLLSTAGITVQSEGRLLNAADQPATGAHTFVVTLYTSAAGGSSNIAWTDTFAGVQVDASGVWSILLGDQNPTPPQKVLLPSDVGPDARWMGIKVDTDGELTPLLPLSEVPVAGLATSASTVFDAAGGAPITASSTAAPGALFPLDASGKFPSSVLDGSAFDAATFDGGKAWADVTGAIATATAGIHDATQLTGAVPAASLPSNLHDATALTGLVPVASLPGIPASLLPSIPASLLPSPLNADTLNGHPGTDFLFASSYKPPISGVERLVLTFDAAPGSGGAVADSSGAGNNGTFSNAIYTSNAGHLSSGAISFSSGGGVVTVPDSPSLEVTNNLTVEAWINLTSYPSAIAGLVGKNGSYELGIDQNGSVQLQIVPGLASQTWAGSSPKVPLATWTHVAGTYDGVEVKIYVNGALVSLTPYAAGPIAVTTQPVYIGGGTASAGITGTMDEVKISAIAKPFAEKVPAYAMYGAGGLTATAGADTVIPLTTTFFESGISHSGNAIHFGSTGVYEVSAGARVATTGDVWQTWAIAKSGTVISYANGYGAAGGSDQGQQTATWLVNIDSTTADYTLVYRVYNGGGGTIVECIWGGSCGVRASIVKVSY